MGKRHEQAFHRRGNRWPWTPREVQPHGGSVKCTSRPRKIPFTPIQLQKARLLTIPSPGKNTDQPDLYRLPAKVGQPFWSIVWWYLVMVIHSPRFGPTIALSGSLEIRGPPESLWKTLALLQDLYKNIDNSTNNVKKLNTTLTPTKKRINK